MSEPIIPVHSLENTQQDPENSSDYLSTDVNAVMQTILTHLHISDTAQSLPPIKSEYQDPGKFKKQIYEIYSTTLCSSKKQSSSIDRLIEKGFVNLAEKLRIKSGYPWDTILKFDNPFLIEQLYDLANIMEVIKDQAPDLKTLYYIEMGIKIASAASEYPSTKLGKLIYIIDRYKGQIDDQEIPLDENYKIDEQFAILLKQTQKSIINNKNTHKKAKLQHAELASCNQLTIELTHYLISSTKHLNIGLVNTIINEFVKHPSISINNEPHLLYVLNELCTSPSLREQLSQIRAPLSSKDPANIVIRTTLAFPPTKTLDDLDAVRTALSALLNRLRQGKEGSCFATPLAICLLNHQLKKCLNDFHQLLEKSKLTRKVDNISLDFPFLLRIGDRNLAKKIRITMTESLILPNGKLIPFDKIPGIIAIKTAMGIDKISIRKQFFQKNKKKILYLDITLKELIQAIVKQAKNLPVNKNKRLSELYTHALFAYQAQECNPLLQTWKNSIACMAEADDQSMVRSAILKSINHVLENFIVKNTEQNPEISKHAAQRFNQLLNENIHLQWDPHITNKTLSTDGHSTGGAFVLYDKGTSRITSKWERLDNSKTYQSFILRTINKVKSEIKTHFSNIKWESIVPIFAKINTYVESEIFLLDSLTDYSPSNAQLINTGHKYESLRYTPWVTKSGNNLQKVMQIYLENPGLETMVHLSPNNGMELLQQLIHMMKNNRKTFSKSIKNIPHFRIPVRIPYLHAFTFLPGHPSFIQFWSEENESQEQIQKQVIEIGKKISETMLSSSSKEIFIRKIINKIIHRPNVTAFYTALQQLPKKINIHEFRKSIVNIVWKLEQDTSFSSHKLATEIDRILYRSLPDSLSAILNASAIHIADTNWAEDGNVIHFALVVNPGTTNIELWGIKNDNSELIPLDQKIWFNNKDWEFFKI